jgi:hypothetical protein
MEDIYIYGGSLKSAWRNIYFPKMFRKVPNCFFCLETLSKSSKEFRKEYRKVPYVPGGTL